jgi:hypothetical protein
VRALGLTSVTVVRAAGSDAAGEVSFVPEKGSAMPVIAYVRKHKKGFQPRFQKEDDKDLSVAGFIVTWRRPR